MTVSYITWRIHMWHVCLPSKVLICLICDILSPPLCMCDMLHSYMTWRIHMPHDAFICDMTHSYVTWQIHMWHVCLPSKVCVCLVWHMTDLCVTWRIHMWHAAFICDMTYAYATWRIHIWHDAFICDMTHSKVCICSTCPMNHSYVTQLIHTWHDDIWYKVRTRNASHVKTLKNMEGFELYIHLTQQTHLRVSVREFLTIWKNHKRYLTHWT